MSAKKSVIFLPKEKFKLKITSVQDNLRYEKQQDNKKGATRGGCKKKVYLNFDNVHTGKDLSWSLF